MVTLTPRRPPKPRTPLTGFELLNYEDYEDTPEAVIDRSYRRLFPQGESPVGARHASPQYALESPPPVSRQYGVPRTPILTRPFYEPVLTEQPPKLSICGEARAGPQPVAKSTKRRTRRPIPSEVRQHVKRLSASKDTGSGIGRRTRQAVKKKAAQAVKTKAKQTAVDEGTKFLKSWLKYK